MSKYYDIMRNSKDKTINRYQIVCSAQASGIAPTAKAFKCSVNTVRKWLSRYESSGKSGLEELSRAPRNSKRLSDADKEIIINAKKELKPLGARRIKEIKGLSYSVRTISKVVKAAGLTERRRKKAKTRKSLRHIKANWELFKQIVVDTKYLDDIPEYFPSMMVFKLPKFQYTAREVTTGLQFISYAHELSISNSVSFIEQIATHLLKNGADLSATTIQTDNGSEFVSWNAKQDTAVTTTIESFGMKHVTIPPKQYTWQSDVETVHNTIETEFYQIEPITSTNCLLGKMATYLLWYNYFRKISSKENQIPINLALMKNPHINTNIAHFLPCILDHKSQIRYHSGDHDVGVMS